MNLSPQFSGLLLFDKPKGITSHDAVDILRRRLNFKKIGHTGTLDPMATGLLVMLLGPSTKYQAKLQNCAKIYSGAITLGVETDTWDAEGKVIKETPVAGMTHERIKGIIGFFTGKVVQQIPSFSAVRYKGKHLYKLARKNTAVPPMRREVNIKWKNYSFKQPLLNFEVECSGGTYVRSIAYEMGRMLGTGGHLSELRRLSVNRWKVDDALNRETLQKLSLEALKARLLEVPPDLKNL
ncbi:MAG: tRNA pseudouridine(55) synthase TruB [Elusimicrobia bacterium RIFOXYA12_FULL_51_18]|nr:MAG: tRNA pseudouridine(55) synthase TruB [Elusimicrobia bacterium RIFOXYA12_FULL_51_18]OGS29581.1 MAG: tRNA pseudouridine(55) synthase TruB [Elusimicrobia bacterium RIFOXYA2_FULL_53_38]